MVTREQFIQGILTYADKEVVPYLPTIGKWGVGSMVLLLSNKADCLISNLSNNTIVKSLDIITDDGLINIELLSKVLVETSNRYGKCEVSIPMIGNLTFSSADVEKMYSYIIGGI